MDALQGLRLVRDNDGTVRLTLEYATGYVTEVCRLNTDTHSHYVSWPVMQDYERLATESLVRLQRWSGDGPAREE